MFKASSESKTGKTIFYCFEISALIVCILLFILAIYNAAKLESFMAFVSGLTNTITSTLILYGLGKICDLLYAKKEAKYRKADQTKIDEN